MAGLFKGNAQDPYKTVTKGFGALCNGFPKWIMDWDWPTHHFEQPSPGHLYRLIFSSIFVAKGITLDMHTHQIAATRTSGLTKVWRDWSTPPGVLKMVKFPFGMWLWVKIGYPFWNPSKWTQGLKPAVRAVAFAGHWAVGLWGC